MVAIRIRPFSERELEHPENLYCLNLENSNTIEVEREKKPLKFKFDFVGHEKIDQLSIFNHIAKPIADTCMQGYNGTIFAYG
jgi:kinesin family protein 15